MGLKTVASGLVVLTGFIQQPVPAIDSALLIHRLSDRFGSHFMSQDPSTRLGLDWVGGSLEPNKKYKEATDSIEQKLLGSPTAFSAMVARLKSTALQDYREIEPGHLLPFEPLPLYCWAYAKLKEGSQACERGMNYWAISANREDLQIMGWLLAAAPQPNSREYLRLRYILQDVAYDQRVANLGRNLLAKMPGDKAVKYALAKHLAKSAKDEDVQEAEKLTEELLQPNPKFLPFLKLGSTIATYRYVNKSTVPNLQRLIKSLKRVTAAAPPNSAESKETSEFLSRMEKLLKKKGG